jgi:hypothetical protein
MSLPPEARAGLMRAWLAILSERHPHLTWVEAGAAPDEHEDESGGRSSDERASG